MFDRNSGDYWVVSLLASLSLKWLQAGGVVTIRELEQRLAPSPPYADLHAALALTLQSLIDNGLVQVHAHLKDSPPLEVALSID